MTITKEQAEKIMAAMQEHIKKKQRKTYQNMIKHYRLWLTN